jgi:AcrR family transcriptional regulator
MRPPRPSTSSFVPTDEREELMAAFAAAAYAEGLAATRLRDVARAVGRGPDAMARFWPDETACLLETVDVATGQAFSRMAEVFLNTDSDCPTAAHHALATLLTDLSTSPEMVHLAVVELPRLGTVAHAAQTRLLDLFCEFLAPGFVAMGYPVPDPEIVSTCLAGGIWETVRRLTVERRLHTLPDVLAPISFVCISTFFGTDEAVRVSRIPVRVEPRVVG